MITGFGKVSGEIFDSIQKSAGGKQRSKSWYRSQLLSFLDDVSALNESPDDGAEREYNIEVGEMYFFSYSAKFAQKYPWYDIYPLTYITDITKEGFIGYNLHYLSPSIRPGYAQSLINRGSGVTMPNKAIHRYLFSQIGSFFSRVPPTEYVGVSVLPVEKFMTVDGDEILSRKIWRS